MTSPLADLRTAFDTAVTAAEQNITIQLASRDQQISGLQSQLASAQAQVTSLQAQLDALRPKAVWGVNATTAAQKKTNDALFNPQVYRYYQNPGEPIAWPKEYQLSGAQTFVYSDKVPLKDKAAGKSDAALTALFKAAPTGRPFYYCVWHEPEDDIERGAFTAADLKAAWARVTPLARAVGSHIKLTPILMNATFLGSKGRNWQDYVPADYDVLGVDAYTAGDIGVPVTGIPHMFDKVVAAAGGKPWLIGEAGVGSNVTGQARLDALGLYVRTARAKGAIAVCYFNNAGWKVVANESAAWKSAQTGA